MCGRRRSVPTTYTTNTRTDLVGSVTGQNELQNWNLSFYITFLVPCQVTKHCYKFYFCPDIAKHWGEELRAKKCFLTDFWPRVIKDYPSCKPMTLIFPRNFLACSSLTSASLKKKSQLPQSWVGNFSTSYSVRPEVNDFTKKLSKTWKLMKFGRNANE